MRVQKIKLKLFFKKTTTKTKILSVPPHFKHNIVLNVEIKENEYRRMTKKKVKSKKKKIREKKKQI
jgi:hypothetical protein